MILLTNQWNGKLVTCDRHRAEQQAHFFGTITESAAPFNAVCERCRQEQSHADAPANMRAAMLHPNFSHTRFRPFGSSGYVTCYHRVSTSPSGVLSAASLDETRFDALYRELREAGLISSSASPLSPTEGL